MEAHLNLQKEHQSRMLKAYMNFKRCSEERMTTSYLQTRLEDLERLWQQFTFDHQEILKLFDATSLQQTEYVTEDLYSVANELYIEYKCDLKEQLAEMEAVPSFTSPIALDSGSKLSQVELPTITIPTFSGKYEEWISFRELFISLIHNSKDIDSVQKLHYLKAHLTGEAEQLLRHKPLTSDSYEQCWTLLKSRYNNKQFLGNNVLGRFFEQKTLFTESATDIKNLLDCTTETLDALSGLGVDTTTWDIIVVYIVSQKLDSDSRRQWECKVSEGLSKSEQLPTITQFRDFLETRYHSMEFMEPKQSCSNDPKFMPNNKDNESIVKSTPIQNIHVTKILCCFCKSSHRIFNCKGFSSLDVKEKRNFVQTNGLCFNCLGEGHAVKFCRNTSSCQICNGRHHSLLHHHGELQSVGTGSADNQAAQDHTQQVTPVQGEAIQNTSVTNHFVNKVAQQVLLATAVVEAETSDKRERHLLRALIDQGSQASFITSAAVQSLGLKRTDAKGLVSGLGGKQNVVSKSTVEVIVVSRVKPGFVLKVTAYVLDELTSFMPSARVTLMNWPELERINLADPEYHTPNQIDLLLGAAVYAQIIDTGLIRCPTNGSPVAQNTSLGWILSGQVGLEEKGSCDMINVNHTQLNQLLRSFKERDSGLSNKSRNLSPEEGRWRCEGVQHATTTKDVNGRFMMGLSFGDDMQACVDGIYSEIAMGRFHSLEKEFQRDRHLLKENTKVFEEYKEPSHMEHPTERESSIQGVKLPYLDEVGVDRETNKVDKGLGVSGKGSNVESVNDILERLKLQQNLRKNKFGELDNANEQILLQVVSEHEVKEVDKTDKFALVTSLEHQEFNMDDLKLSCKTDEEAVKKIKQVSEMLNKRGFKLRTWLSNNEAISNEGMKSVIGKADKKHLEIKQKIANKMLRLTWDRGRLEFAFAGGLPYILVVPVV